tara:strand:- start:1312 stop:1686 length:375 start_codon:yes stop_codon:yes gene_type:complete
MKQIKWKFKGTEVYFVNPENKMASAVFKQANRLGLDPTKTKIEIINEFFTLRDDLTGCRSCNGNTASAELPALHLVSETTEVGPTADDMRDMLRLLDKLSGTSADSEDHLDDSDTPGVNDRLAL